MNVAELIEQLRQFPPDLPVVVNGYEGGATEKIALGVVLIDPDTGGGYEGEHSIIVLAFDETIDEYPNRRTALLLDSRQALDYAMTPEKAETRGC